MVEVTVQFQKKKNVYSNKQMVEVGIYKTNMFDIYSGISRIQQTGLFVSIAKDLSIVTKTSNAFEWFLYDTRLILP